MRQTKTPFLCKCCKKWNEPCERKIPEPRKEHWWDRSDTVLQIPQKYYQSWFYKGRFPVLLTKEEKEATRLNRIEVRKRLDKLE